MSKFTEITPYEIDGNMIDKIDNEWMLVTAGNGEKVNTMTASWGGVGVLWNLPVAFVFIRPQRYTFEFTEAEDTMTLSFFGDGCRDALKLCGTVSGRDCDKIKEAGLTLRESHGMPCFEEATLTLFCRKRYADFLNADSFIDKSLIAKNYPKNDFHKVYVCEIIAAEVKVED